MKNNYIRRNIVNFFNSSLFKGLLFLLVIMSLFAVSNDNNVGIIDSITLVFSNYIFLSLCILPMFLFLTVFVYDSFVKDIFAITRYKDKSVYLKELLKNIFVVNSIFFLIILLIVIIIENVLNFNGYKVLYNDIRNSYNLIYMVFVIIKLYIFIIVYSLIDVLLIKLFNSKIIILLNFIFFAFVFYSGFNVTIINSLVEMSLYINNYLVNNMIFNNFFNEVFANVLMISGLIIVVVILFNISKKQKKDIV